MRVEMGFGKEVDEGGVGVVCRVHRSVPGSHWPRALVHGNDRYKSAIEPVTTAFLSRC